MPKSVTRTVRLEEDLDLAIQDRARDLRVTVNFLVNRAVRKFVEWDIPSEKFGMVIIASALLNKLFDEVDEQTCFKLGRSIAVEVFRPFMEYLFGELTVRASILLLKRASEYGGRFVFDEARDTKKHILIIRHDLGQKGSMYYSGLLEGVFRDLLGKHLKVDCTAALCIAQFEDPS
jgi:hypothetical protein